MATISVDYLDRDRFTIQVRGHRLTVDQPGVDGGDSGPTAAELLVASLAASFVGNARRYLARFGLPTDRLRVTAEYTLSVDWPQRVTSISLVLQTPSDVPPGWMQALRGVAMHCPVYTSIAYLPKVDVEVVHAPRRPDADWVPSTAPTAPRAGTKAPAAPRR
jgi:putative redox protein